MARRFGGEVNPTRESVVSADSAANGGSGSDGSAPSAAGGTLRVAEQAAPKAKTRRMTWVRWESPVARPRGRRCSKRSPSASGAGRSSVRVAIGKTRTRRAARRGTSPPSETTPRNLCSVAPGVSAPRDRKPEHPSTPGRIQRDSPPSRDVHVLVTMVRGLVRNSNRISSEDPSQATPCPAQSEPSFTSPRRHFVRRNSTRRRIRWDCRAGGVSHGQKFLDLIASRPPSGSFFKIRRGYPVHGKEAVESTEVAVCKPLSE